MAIERALVFLAGAPPFDACVGVGGEVGRGSSDPAAREIAAPHSSSSCPPTITTLYTQDSSRLSPANCFCNRQNRLLVLYCAVVTTCSTAPAQSLQSCFLPSNCLPLPLNEILEGPRSLLRSHFLFWAPSLVLRVCSTAFVSNA